MERWNTRGFDRDFIWRDAHTKEVFMFDLYGYWNEETLKHPLLN